MLMSIESIEAARLARAVIAQAIDDLVEPRLTTRNARRGVVDEARAFLLGEHPDNKQARADRCLIAGIHPDDLRRRVLALL